MMYDMAACSRALTPPGCSAVPTEEVATCHMQANIDEHQLLRLYLPPASPAPSRSQYHLPIRPNLPAPPQLQPRYRHACAPRPGLANYSMVCTGGVSVSTGQALDEAWVWSMQPGLNYAAGAAPTHISTWAFAPPNHTLPRPGPRVDHGMMAVRGELVGGVGGDHVLDVQRLYAFGTWHFGYRDSGWSMPWRPCGVSGRVVLRVAGLTVSAGITRVYCGCWGPTWAMQ